MASDCLPPPELHLPPVRPPSSSSSKKKTRELPNLSDCHRCSRRINSTNPKERLRILTSEWRIVLLCKQCYRSVESAQVCSYCLTGEAEQDNRQFRQCPKCRRRIHEDCVLKYSTFGPWSVKRSGSASGTGSSHSSSVCIDCWAPKLPWNLKSRSSKVPGVRARKNEKAIADSFSPGNSGVSDDPPNKPKSLEVEENKADCLVGKKLDTKNEAKEKALRKSMVAKRAVELASVAIADSCSPGNSGVSDDPPNKPKSLEVEENKADCEVRKKLDIANEAKEKALRKAMIAKKAVELASGALALVSEKEEQKREGFDTAVVVIDDDAELAFKLHRAMNSSPRITNPSCLLNKKCSNVPTVVLDGNCTHTLEISHGKPLIDLGGVGSQTAIQTSSSNKSTNVRSGEDSPMDVEPQSPIQQGVHLNEGDRNGGEKCDSNTGVMLLQRCNTVRDRYSLKYSRKRSAMHIVD